MKEAGFDVTQLCGLTECYGPAIVNDWNSDWDALSDAEQAQKKAGQGVRYLALEGMDIINLETMRPVPCDGATVGEAVMRGNAIMKGYLKNSKATQKAFKAVWFHIGDLGVMYPSGCIQLKDRSRNIITFGGENISSIEV